jgi:hypothetical protein
LSGQSKQQQGGVQRVAAERKAQGLPERIEDEQALAKVAALMAGGRRG